MQAVIAAAVGRAFSPTAPPSDVAILSPKTAETTEISSATEMPLATECVAPSADDNLSPKTSAATEWPPATEFTSATNTFPLDALALAEHLVSTKCPEAWFENDDFDHPDAAAPRNAP